MIEITNKTKGPIQILIRSRLAPKSFTTLNIPGIGASNNRYNLEDERSTEYVERAEKLGLISLRHIPNNELKN